MFRFISFCDGMVSLLALFFFLVVFLFVCYFFSVMFPFFSILASH